MSRDYAVGDKVWYIPGFGGDGLLAVECLIDEVDDDFRKKEPQAYLFYWIDEPVGHGLVDDELFATREDAFEELLARAQEEENPKLDADLDRLREMKVRFVVGTWKDLDESEKAEKITDWMKRLSLLGREYGKHWFNLSSPEVKA